MKIRFFKSIVIFLTKIIEIKPCVVIFLSQTFMIILIYTVHLILKMNKITKPLGAIKNQMHFENVLNL